MFSVVFGHGPNLAWSQECARAVLIFVYGLLLVRLSGRRSFGKWSPVDIVTSVVVGSSLSRALTGNAALIGTLLATSLVMLLHGLLAQACARSSKLSAILEGTPVTLGENGNIDPARLSRYSISRTDLEEALRGSNVEAEQKTRRITLEPSGKISILKS